MTIGFVPSSRTNCRFANPSIWRREVPPGRFIKEQINAAIPPPLHQFQLPAELR
jgi:hypothetical protein